MKCYKHFEGISLATPLVLFHSFHWLPSGIFRCTLSARELAVSIGNSSIPALLPFLILWISLSTSEDKEIAVTKYSETACFERHQHKVSSILEEAVSPTPEKNVKTQRFQYPPSTTTSVKSRFPAFFPGHVSTAPSLENNMDKLGVEGASSRGGSFVSRTPSPSPSSRSRSRDRKNSAKHATGHLAAHAFNLMVTVPQHITKDALEDDGAPSMGKLTPDLLGGHHYEADVSDQSDSFLGLPPG
nr:uncharacterized protein LOC113809774 [Penaeus vannamei]